MRNAYCWLTCAIDEGQVGPALILAASLRRVQTTATLVVIAASNLPKCLGDKLGAGFDLVVPLVKDDDEDNGYDDDHDVEAPAVVQAFTLVQFDKVVYLSPKMVVVLNCDEIFEAGNQSVFCGGKGGFFDPSVMLIYPSAQFHDEFIKKTTTMMMESGRGKGGWRRSLFEALKMSVPLLECLNQRYNVEVELFPPRDNNKEKRDDDIGFGDVAIGNFVKRHPWSLWSSGLDLKSGNETDCEHVFDQLGSMAVDLILSQKRVSSKNGANWSSGGGGQNEPIAIVGLSFRLPGGNTEEEFWKLLIERRDAIRPVPPGRWAKGQSMLHYNPAESGGVVEAGFLNVPIDEFDAKFFGTLPKEAVVLDPQIRLLHEVSWEALEQGGIDPSSLRGTQTGIFVGSWMLNYMDLLSRASTAEQNMFRVYMGNSIGAESARLSHFLGTTGPAISTESGCSSSMVAVHLGVKSLRNRECHLALACGVNLLIHPFTCGMMEGVLAPDYRCKTFDAKADGFARAEGVAALVMKRASDAVRDGDSIWGLIRGSAVVQEGHSKSLGTPTVHCEALAMELALKDAGVDGGDVDYIEAHGTGTAVGDPMEIAAITKAYKTDGGRGEPLIIGSVKTNVGHTESASPRE